MSFIDTALVLDKKGKIDKRQNPVSLYSPNEVERDRISLIRSDMTQGDVTQKRPRREFNDLAFIERLGTDQMAWSVYQPNDGDALQGDIINSWRSNAVRPIVRNKIFSIAAHITAHTLFPKIFAFDKDSTEQDDAAQVMSDIIEWTVTNTNSTYSDAALGAVISALVNPVSIVQSQYVEVWKDVKREKLSDGKYRMERILDEDNSGFTDEVVPPEQIFIQDFYQRDIQKQGWVIRRRVRPFTVAQTLYSSFDNFQYVKPGVQVIYNDANGQQFYESYDMTQRQDEVEEVLYWNKSLDLFLIVVNGVLLTDAENANPREDKLYPFAAFGYEFLRPAGDCFYWKSLAFKTMPDDKIVNTLYPMIIDGSYLAIMPPMINVGGEIIESDVIVPGRVTTFSNPEADLKPLAVQSENLKAGFEALQKVETDINEDAFNPMQQGDMPDGGGNMPAYNMSKLEANAKILMGPFLDTVGRYVKQMGRLRIGDIKQHMTLPEITAIEGSASADLVYKSFVLPQGKSRKKTKKIQFSLDMPTEPISKEDEMKLSYNILKEEGGLEAKSSLAKVNPVLFRDLKYICFVGTDVLKPMSEEVEAAWSLQTYDRMVMAPQMFDPEETARLLMSISPTTRRHPDKYIAKAPQGGQPNPMEQAMGQNQGQNQPQNQLQKPMSTPPQQTAPQR